MESEVSLKILIVLTSGPGADSVNNYKGLAELGENKQDCDRSSTR